MYSPSYENLGAVESLKWARNVAPLVDHASEYVQLENMATLIHGVLAKTREYVKKKTVYSTVLAPDRFLISGRSVSSCSRDALLHRVQDASLKAVAGTRRG